MRTDRIAALLTSFMTLAAAACIIPVYIDDPRGFPRSASRMFEKTVPWENGRAVAVENPAGDVEVFGWERKEVQVTAEWGWDSSRSRVEVPSPGRDIPDVEVEPDGDLLRIRLRAPVREEDTARPVRFILNVPQAVDLKDVVVRRGRVTVGDIYGRTRVAVEEGDVRVENYSGSLEVSVGRGSAEAEILDLRPEDVVRLAARQGPVTLFLEAGVDARIEAEAANGRVISDFALGTGPDSRKVAAVIGREKGGTVALVSGMGDVRIRKVRDIR
ncbi:MAG: hypothetical protein FJY80_00400 [Candidatus Aminicenantes bacterium]|nr:hypothetical protein [Candidatus Aminicenantes bacterium]